MTFAKPASKQKDEIEHNSYCSVDGCHNIWAVRQDGDKQKCSFHQWINDPVKKKRSFSDLPELKVKTVAQWYDEKEVF
mgnify:FL=1|jgi:hypothetical protein